MSIAVLTSITLVLAGAIVLVVAYHLIGIYLNLKKTADNLELLAGGLVQINQNTAPLGEGIGQLNGGLSELLEDFKGALGNDPKPKSSKERPHQTANQRLVWLEYHRSSQEAPSTGHLQKILNRYC